MLKTGDFVQLCDRYSYAVRHVTGRVAMVSQTQAYVFGLHDEGVYDKESLCRVTLTFAGVVRHAPG